MAMQFYASPEQIMRDRSEYARKGISRGRSAVVLTYEGGVLFVAENFTSLRKISEIYDRIGFAAVGRYNEFENLRRAGVRMADLNGFSYDRRDVTGRALANAYTQTLGAIFTQEQKPFEVEICVAQVGTSPAEDELYRITYDGSVNDEPGFMAMGGQAEAISSVLRERHEEAGSLASQLKLAVQALASIGGEGGAPRTVGPNQLEVAVLDRRRRGRTFRRITGAALTALLDGDPSAAAAKDAEPVPPQPGPQTPVTSAASADLETAGESRAADGPAGAAAREAGADKPETAGADEPETAGADESPARDDA